MAVVANALKSLTGQDQEAAKKREALEVLQEAANNKIRDYREEIEEIYTNPRNQDWMIVGHRLNEEVSESRVTVKNDDTFKKEMSSAIGDFFQGTSQGVKDGFQTVLTTAINSLLVSTEVGERTFRKFAIITENNAILRVDIRMWKRTFVQGGMFGEWENVFVYYAAKSIVDHRKLTLDELTYYVTAMAGPNATKAEVKTLITDLKDIWAALEGQTVDMVASQFVALR